MDREKRLREMCNAIFRDRFKDVDVPVNMRYIRKPNMTFDYLVKDTMMSISVPLVLIELPTEYQRAVADAIHLKYEGKNKELEELRKTMKRYAKDGKLTKYAGAGLLVPITGFANGVASPAVEAAPEGEIFGKGVQIFTIARPVILYGVFASWLFGLIYWLMHLI